MPKHFPLLPCIAGAFPLPLVLANKMVFVRDGTKSGPPLTPSKADAFSTLCALCPCCLSQPHGSLLIPGRGSLVQRLSPLAALVDGLLISYRLVTTPGGEPPNESGRPDGRHGSKEQPLPMLVANASRLSRVLHRCSMIAGALLLIRSSRHRHGALRVHSAGAARSHRRRRRDGDLGGRW